MQSLSHNENYLVASDVELFSKVPDSEYASLADTHTSFTNTQASVLAAVEQGGLVLESASEALELTERVLTAVKHNAFALDHASKRSS